MIDNTAFGGFIVSKNVLKGIPVRYTYREPSAQPQLNGWHLLSEIDDDEFVNEISNFVIVSAETIYPYCPLLFVIFNAPYGTDLFWQYNDDGTLYRIYDLKNDCETTLEQIMNAQENNSEGKKDE